ncbi:aminotransferase class I/II-fold pyridoxal phosphate-dependent enzyme [Natronosporangium hydrolyticum]|uniref:Aminotransferase class I/II-fold pyridoxal phosphate-dependent enzyme n=1 Tax=Natronosporangium hydrolyticum TaxID=2811111 RepID=A0A895Y6T0_9ACTN|nr:aminotransferase class I/II-fold pyridoxal phosphate-dependent enzyme [Natronosporangium hydrolyticum]QSB13444.1 aminotransferase class I/II-fold pyridoxal phosphate-dependent enzyme [Natronosporangium hydrolyticum]
MAEQYHPTGRTAAEIAASIEAGVRDGALASGASLPPVRGLAADLGVSPATVAAAYRSLRQRGVVETAGRHGTRVRPRPPVVGDRAARRLPVPPGAWDLSSGGPDGRLLPDLSGPLSRLAARPGPAGSYPEAGTVPELADLARQRLAADGVPLTGADLIITGGALDGIERLLTAHLNAGDRVAVEDPGWANLLDLVAALGLVAVPLPMDNHGPTGPGLQRALAAGARAVIVTTRAHNPTGVAVTQDRAAELRPLLANHPEVLLVEDDHAAELAGVPLHPLAGAAPRWAFVRSTSKPYGPDLRLAVVAGDAATVGRVAGRIRAGAGWVSTVLQRLVVELWRDPDVAQLIAGAEQTYRRRREALCRALTEHGLAGHGDTGINVWAPVTDETRTVTALREAGYAVAPGALFRQAAGPGIRITVSSLPEAQIPALARAVAAAEERTVGRGHSV